MTRNAALPLVTACVVMAAILALAALYAPHTHPTHTKYSGDCLTDTECAATCAKPAPYGAFSCDGGPAVDNKEN